MKALAAWADAWVKDIATMYAAWHAWRDGADDGSALAAALAALGARLDAELAGSARGAGFTEYVPSGRVVLPGLVGEPRG